MIKLTKDEELLLGEIEENKYANGPFAGMIFNAIRKDNMTIEDLIKLALKVRVVMRDMSRGTTTSQTPLPKFAGVPKPKAEIMKKQQEYNDKKMTEQ